MAALPYGAWSGLAIATFLISGFKRSFNSLTSIPEDLFTARTTTPSAYRSTEDEMIWPLPLKSFRYFMSAAKKISKGAPPEICFASMPVEPNDNMTLIPVSFSNTAAMSLNAKLRPDAAAAVILLSPAEAAFPGDKRYSRAATVNEKRIKTMIVKQILFLY